MSKGRGGREAAEVSRAVAQQGRRMPQSWQGLEPIQQLCALQCPVMLEQTHFPPSLDVSGASPSAHQLSHIVGEGSKGGSKAVPMLLQRTYHNDGMADRNTDNSLVRFDAHWPCCSQHTVWHLKLHGNLFTTSYQLILIDESRHQECPRLLQRYITSMAITSKTDHIFSQLTHFHALANTVSAFISPPCHKLS